MNSIVKLSKTTIETFEGKTFDGTGAGAEEFLKWLHGFGLDGEFYFKRQGVETFPKIRVYDHEGNTNVSLGVYPGQTLVISRETSRVDRILGPAEAPEDHYTILKSEPHGEGEGLFQ